MLRDYPEINTRVLKEKGEEITELVIVQEKNNAFICDLEYESKEKT
jgi:hypothetical protein